MKSTYILASFYNYQEADIGGFLSDTRGIIQQVRLFPVSDLPIALNYIL